MSDKYLNDFKMSNITFSEASNALNEQYNTLNSVYFSLMSGSVKLYAIAKREKERNSRLTITLKQIGFVGGALQYMGGFGICEASLGAACSSLGLGLMSHGAENAWENGYYLVYRKEPNLTPLRNAYRYSATLLGGGETSGDIAYSVGDISLSLGSAFRLGLKPEAWRFFYYIREDYIIGWKAMGAAGLVGEAVGNSASGFTIHQLMHARAGSNDWEVLSK